MTRTGKNRDDIKKTNRGLVLKMLATGQCHNRMDLVRKTGLSKMTISNIISEMLGQNLIYEEKEETIGEMGRPPVVLKVSDQAPCVLGVLIARNRIEGIVCRLNLEIVRRTKIDISGSYNADQLMKDLVSVIDQLLMGNNIVSIGISCMGPVNISKGKMENPNFFFGIHDVEILHAVKERYDYPIVFNHDNQSAVLAESLFGNGRGYNDIILIGVNAGVGCGILSDGKINHNHKGMAAEFGHISIDYNGELCVCGNRGCLENYIRTPKMMAKLKESSLLDLTYKEFGRLQENRQVGLVFEDAIAKLSAALINAVNLLNSECILLSDDFVYWNDAYVKCIEENINRRRFLKTGPHIAVKKAYFNPDTALMGSAAIALAPIFDGEIIFG